jgi:hypothetical protein
MNAKKYLILVLMILVIVGQFPHELNCIELRKFSVLFKKSRKEKGIEKPMKELQNKLSVQEDETKREIIRKYLLPHAGRTSFMNDFINRF